MISIASALGESIAYCLLWWPLAFVALKASLHLVYRWQPFILGFALNVTVVAAVILLGEWSAEALGYASIWQSDSTAGLWLTRFIRPAIGPIAINVLVGFLMRRSFTPRPGRSPSPVAVPPIDARPSAAIRSIEVPSVRIGKSAFVIYLIAAALILLSIAFPPWVHSGGPNSTRIRLGYGTFLNPSRSSIVRAAYACSVKLPTAIAGHKDALAKRNEYDRDLAIYERDVANQRRADAETLAGGKGPRANSKAYFVDIPPSLPSPSPEEAAVAVDDVKTECNRDVEMIGQGAELDYARLFVQLSVVALLSALALKMTGNFRRPTK